MSRTLHLFGDIEEKTVKDICKSIIEINEEDAEQEAKLKEYKRSPIKLYIDSYGGECYACLSLISVIRTSKTPIHTICNGYAMSAGALIFISGHRRFITENTTIMIHQLSNGKSGKYMDFKDHIEEIEDLQEKLNSIVFKYTKIKPTQLKKYYDKKKDWYLYTEEILRLKIADELIKEEC